ncbi:MAG: histidine kinase [Acidobacteriota bacterium]|nr:histidine kinase [Acidobacteriota bacterium]
MEGDSTTQLLEAGAYERRMLARRLHDTVSQSLVALSLQMASTLELGPEPPLREQFNEAMEQLDRCLAEVRALSDSLHPIPFGEPLLDASVKEYLDALARQTGSRVTFQIAADCDGVPLETQRGVLTFIHDNLQNFVFLTRECTTLVRVWRDGDSLRAGFWDDGDRTRCEARFAFPGLRA